MVLIKILFCGILLVLVKSNYAAIKNRPADGLGLESIIASIVNQYIRYRTVY